MYTRCRDGGGVYPGWYRVVYTRDVHMVVHREAYTPGYLSPKGGWEPLCATFPLFLKEAGSLSSQRLTLSPKGGWEPLPGCYSPLFPGLYLPGCYSPLFPVIPWFMPVIPCYSLCYSRLFLVIPGYSSS